jgi:hypothetical protein
MPSEDQIDRIYAAACQAVSNILGSQTFGAWAKREQPQVGDLMVFNNSFLYREYLTSTLRIRKILNDLVRSSRLASACADAENDRIHGYYLGAMRRDLEFCARP